MRIQELEQIVGTDRATIRFYEKEGLIAPRRLENGYRDYTEENAEELRKIRLLRQLGVSIIRIRSLQQGSEDFQQVLSDQIRTLTTQISEQKRARALCLRLQEDGARYENLNAGHYLTLLETIQADEKPAIKTDFKETIPEEIHPWKRYFARMLDYFMLDTVITFFIVVVLRIRPVPGEFLNTLIVIASGALFIPIEALMLSQWGTTPGKYIFGICVESIQGGNLSYSQALDRAKAVYVEGVFLRIPYLSLYALVRRYCLLTGRSYRRFTRYDEMGGPQEMYWDQENECELSYSGWYRKRGVVLGVLVALAATLTLTTASDSIRPTHRGSQLTIEQFAENYNDCLVMLQDEIQIYDKLQPDGTKYPVPPNQAVIDVSYGGEFKPLEYEYVTENGFLKAVVIDARWVDVFYLTPLNRVMDPVMPILLAQDGIGLKEISEFSKLFESCLGQTEGSFTFRDLVKVQWTIEAENCEIRNGSYFTIEGAESSSVEFLCTITILK